MDNYRDETGMKKNLPINTENGMPVPDDRFNTISFSEEKERLKLLAEEHLAEINSQVRGVGQKVKTVSPATLVIGGALFLLYIAGRKIFKKNKPKAFNDPSLNQLVVKTPEKGSFIGRKIKEQMTLFLISVMRERLTSYLREPSNRNEPLQSTQREKK